MSYSPHLAEAENRTAANERRRAFPIAQSPNDNLGPPTPCFSEPSPLADGHLGPPTPHFSIAGPAKRNLGPHTPCSFVR